MKKLLFMLFFFCFGFNSPFGGWGAFAQNPLVKMWDKRFGGTDEQQLYSFQQTNDGGYVLGGCSRSNISGDKTQDDCDVTGSTFDYWIIKIDSSGNKLWDKDFGGPDWDWLYSLQQTSDGGYILGGLSHSNIGCDKSQVNWDMTGNTPDYWIVKIDSLGNKVWDKDFGGTQIEVLSSSLQTYDGGYILGGWSSSGISGDKTTSLWGGADYWIIKIDSLGNKQWEKDFGGTGVDFFTTLQQTRERGYILGGFSNSGISGDKTQANWDTATVSSPTYDYWILKLDSIGNKEWDKRYGGINDDQLYSIKQTSDDGYILGGLSLSGISGNKTQLCWGFADYWIVKTDSLGNMQWDKDFGGTDDEIEFSSVVQTDDSGFLIGGLSKSNLSGDKTENNLGIQQSWVIKTDPLGNKIWDRTLLVNGKTEEGFAIETRDKCYTIADFNNGTIGGDKTQNCWGGIDYWIIKLCDSTILQSLFTSSPNLCPGTCTNFTNLSFNAISYQWNFFGATPPTSTDVNPQNICYANPGTYDVQLIATNANGSDTLTLANYITVYPTPPPQSITQNGDTLFALTGAASYQWYFNTNIISGATNYFYVADTSGDYNVVATDANGCEVEAAVFNVIAAAPPVLPEGEVITAAPNPVVDKFTIHNFKVRSGTAIEISIYNMLGEMVLAVSPLSFGEGQGGEADVSQLPSSIYYLEVSDGEKVFRTKFVKQ